MKTVILQNNDVVQVVFTPENPWEERALAMIPDSDFKIHRGSFYQECRGGWYKEFEDDKSLMFVQQKEKKVLEGE